MFVKGRFILDGVDFRRKANRHGSHIRSTSTCGRTFQLDTSLVAAGREVLLGKQDLPKWATASDHTPRTAFTCGSWHDWRIISRLLSDHRRASLGLIGGV